MIRSRIGTVFVAVVALGSITILAPATHALAHGRKTAPPVFTSPPGMAYDEAARQVVLFGSEATDGGGLTWTWDGSAWSQRHPKHEPPWRLGAGMAYDAATQEVLLFGGGGHGFLGDTWTWDGSDWTRQHPAHSPSPRYQVGMAYDAADGEVVLFGGIVENDPFQSQTWTWDGTDWTRQHPGHSPSIRSNPGMAYDERSGQVVLFGGIDSFMHVLGDTWTWDGKSLDAASPCARTLPKGRHGDGRRQHRSAGPALWGRWGELHPRGHLGMGRH